MQEAEKGAGTERGGVCPRWRYSCSDTRKWQLEEKRHKTKPICHRLTDKDKSYVPSYNVFLAQKHYHHTSKQRPKHSSCETWKSMWAIQTFKKDWEKQVGWWFPTDSRPGSWVAGVCPGSSAHPTRQAPSWAGRGPIASDSPTHTHSHWEMPRTLTCTSVGCGRNLEGLELHPESGPDGNLIFFHINIIPKWRWTKWHHLRTCCVYTADHGWAFWVSLVHLCSHKQCGDQFLASCQEAQVPKCKEKLCLPLPQGLWMGMIGQLGKHGSGAVYPCCDNTS